MRVAWITDPHLNFLPYVTPFGEYVMGCNPDAVLLTGDISESHTLVRDLLLFKAGLRADVPVWFVLGNHDSYRSSVASTKEEAQEFAAKTPGFTYLSTAQQEAILLTEGTYLVGTDGWYSAQTRNAIDSLVEMSDFEFVEEMRVRRGSALERRVGRVSAAGLLAYEDARLAEKQLHKVLLKTPAHVVIATHVPPYAEASFHEGGTSDEAWAPWFSNLHLGAVLDTFAKNNPAVKFSVYCGHTHTAGTYKRRPNLTVFVGAAAYGNPHIAELYFTT